MQEHERTVVEARNSMAGFDDCAPLKRWFQNYVDERGAIFWSGGWVVVTRDGRRWKIEFGTHDNEKPWITKYADPNAPTPPIFEWRAPKPEPVRPRFNNPPPDLVPQMALGALTMAIMEEMYRNVMPSRYLVTDYEPSMRYARYFDRPTFDRISRPPPPPPTRRNQ